MNKFNQTVFKLFLPSVYWLLIILTTISSSVCLADTAGEAKLIFPGKMSLVTVIRHSTFSPKLAPPEDSPRVILQNNL